VEPLTEIETPNRLQEAVRRFASRRELRSIVRFGMVGSVGFAVDAGWLTVLTRYGGMSPYSARVVSFLFAITVTWMLNRRFTFASHNRRRAEYTRHVCVQLIGGATNYAIFAALLWRFPDLERQPVIPLAFASGVAMFVNYFGSRVWTFAQRAPEPVRVPENER